MDVASPLQKDMRSLSLPESNCEDSSSLLSPGGRPCSLQLVVYPFSSSSHPCISSSSHPNEDERLRRERPPKMQGKKHLHGESTNLSPLLPSPTACSRPDTSSSSPCREMLPSIRPASKSLLLQASSLAASEDGGISQIPSETEGCLSQGVKPFLNGDFSSTSLVPVASSSSPPPAPSSSSFVLATPSSSSSRLFHPSSSPPSCCSPSPRAGVIHESSFPIFFPCSSSSCSPSPSPHDGRSQSPSYFYPSSFASFSKEASPFSSSFSSSSSAIFLPVHYAFTTTPTTIAHPGAFSLSSRGVHTPHQDSVYSQPPHPSYFIDEKERSSRWSFHNEKEGPEQEEPRIQEEVEEEENSSPSSSSLLALQSTSRKKRLHALSQKGRRSDGLLTRDEEEQEEQQKREEMQGEDKQLQGSIELEEKEICFSQEGRNSSCKSKRREDEEREGHTCMRERKDSVLRERRRKTPSSSSFSDDVNEKEEVDSSIEEAEEDLENQKEAVTARGILKRRSIPPKEEEEGGMRLDARRASLLLHGEHGRHNEETDHELVAWRGRARSHSDREEAEGGEKPHPLELPMPQGDRTPHVHPRQRTGDSEKLQRDEEEEEGEKMSPATHRSTRGVCASLSSSPSAGVREEEYLSREGWGSIHHRFPHLRVNPSKHFSSSSPSSSSCRYRSSRDSPPHSPRALLEYLRSQGCYESSFSLQRNPLSPHSAARQHRDTSRSRRRGCMYTPRSHRRFTPSTRLLTPAEISAQLLLQHSQRREEEEGDGPRREEQGEERQNKKKKRTFQRFSLHGRPLSFSASSSSLPSRFLELSKRNSLPSSFKIRQRSSRRDIHPSDKQRRNEEEEEDDLMRYDEEGEGEEEDGTFLSTSIEGRHSFAHSSFSSSSSPPPRRMISSSPAFARLLSRASSGSTRQRRRRGSEEKDDSERDRQGGREGRGKTVTESRFPTSAASTRRQSTRHHRSSSSSCISSSSPGVESRRQREKETPGQTKRKEGEEREEKEREGRREEGGPFSSFWNLFNSRSIDEEEEERRSTRGEEGLKKKKNKEDEESKKIKGEEEKRKDQLPSREKARRRRKNAVDAWGCEIERPLLLKEKDSHHFNDKPLSFSSSADVVSCSPHLSTSRSFILKMPSDPSVFSEEKSFLKPATSLPRIYISDSNDEEDRDKSQRHSSSSPSPSPPPPPPLSVSIVEVLPSSEERPGYQEDSILQHSHSPSRSRDSDSSHDDHEVYVHPTPISPPSSLPSFSLSSSHHYHLSSMRSQENSMESQDALSYERQEMKKKERKMKGDLSIGHPSDKSSRRLQSIATCPSTTIPEDTGDEEDEEDDENNFDADESRRHEASFFHEDTATHSVVRSTYIPVGSLEGRSRRTRRRRREKEEEDHRCRVASPRDFPPPTFERILFGLPDDDGEEEGEEEEEEIGEKKEKKTSKQRENTPPGRMKDEGKEVVGEDVEARGSRKKTTYDHRREGRREDAGEKQPKKTLPSEIKRKENEKEDKRRDLVKRRSSSKSMNGEQDKRSPRKEQQGKRGTREREEKKKRTATTKKKTRQRGEEEEFGMGEEEKILSDFLSGREWIERQDRRSLRLIDGQKRSTFSLASQENVSPFMLRQGREDEREEVDEEEDVEELPKRERRKETHLQFTIEQESVHDESYLHRDVSSEREEGDEQETEKEKKRHFSDHHEDSRGYEERSPPHYPQQFKSSPKAPVMIRSPSHLPYASSSFFSPAPPYVGCETIRRNARKNDGKTEKEKEMDLLHEEDDGEEKDFGDDDSAHEEGYEDRDEETKRGRCAERQVEEEWNLVEVGKKERAFLGCDIHQQRRHSDYMSTSLSFSSSCFFDPSKKSHKDARRARRREKHQCHSSSPSSNPDLPCGEERMKEGSRSKECRAVNKKESREDRGRERRRREKKARVHSASREGSQVCFSAKRRVKSPLKTMRQAIATTTTTPPTTPGVCTPGNEENDISGVYTPSGKMRSLREEEKTLHPPLYGRSSFSSLPTAASSTSCLKTKRASSPSVPSLHEKCLSRRNRLPFLHNSEAISSPSSSALLSSSLCSSAASTLSLSSLSSSLCTSFSSSSSLEEEGEEEERQQQRRERRRRRERCRKEEDRQRHLDTEKLATEVSLGKREERENLDPSRISSSYSSVRMRGRSRRHEELGRKKGQKNLDSSTSPRKMIPPHSLYIPPLRLSSASFSSRKISSSSSSSRLIDGSSLSCRYTSATTARSAVPRGKFGGGSSGEEDEEGASSARRDRAYLSSLFALPFVSSPTARSKLQETVSRYALFKLCHDDDDEEDQQTEKAREEKKEEKEQPLLSAPPGKAKKKPLSLALLEQLEGHVTQPAVSSSSSSGLRMQAASVSGKEGEANRLGGETKGWVEGERELEEEDEEKERTRDRKEGGEDMHQSSTEEEVEDERGVEEEYEEERGGGYEERGEEVQEEVSKREDDEGLKTRSDRDDEALLLNSLRLLKQSLENERKEKERSSPSLSLDRPRREEDPAKKSSFVEKNSLFQKESFVSLDIFSYDCNRTDREAGILDAKKRSFSTPLEGEEENESAREEGKLGVDGDADNLDTSLAGEAWALRAKQSNSAGALQGEENGRSRKKVHKTREKERTGSGKEDVPAVKNDCKMKEKERERKTSKKKREIKMIESKSSHAVSPLLVRSYDQGEEGKKHTLSLLQRVYHVLSTPSSSPPPASSLPVSLTGRDQVADEERQQTPASTLDSHDKGDLSSSPPPPLSVEVGDEALKKEHKTKSKEKMRKEREKEGRMPMTMKISKTQDERMHASQIREEIAKLKSLLISCKEANSSSSSSSVDISPASVTTQAHPCEDEEKISKGEEESEKGERQRQRYQPKKSFSSSSRSLLHPSSLLLVQDHSTPLSGSSSSSSSSYLPRTAYGGDTLIASPSHKDFEDNGMLKMKILSSSEEEEMCQGIPNAFDTLWRKSVQAHKTVPGLRQR